jgi:SAM-dependent methyltransferase/uncharacterized protein YbaR (Trm112 family)
MKKRLDALAKSAESTRGKMKSIDQWYLENLVCPVEHTTLRFDGEKLSSLNGRCYPVVDGVPVMLVDSAEQTLGVAEASILRAEGRSEIIDQRAPDLYLESLGISDEEKVKLVSLVQDGRTVIDPVVMMIIAATCGNSYKDLVGNRRLKEYPIPSFDLTPSNRRNLLLDIGCNWGRWTIAAARKGFLAVGIDPSLGAVMAARRIARQLNLEIKYVVADGRFLPFYDEKFDVVHCYSVLQHFNKQDAKGALSEIRRALKVGGLARIQMANKWGLRSIQHQAQRRFRDPNKFEVRYWTVAELISAFSERIGKTKLSVDCYFGLGWQWCDFWYLSGGKKLILIASELLKRLSIIISPMRVVADSLICTAVKSKIVLGVATRDGDGI